MKRPFTILIADRNPHVRKFLMREFAADGFLVQVAKSGQEVLRLVFSHKHLDLLVLDPDRFEPDIYIGEALANR